VVGVLDRGVMSAHPLTRLWVVAALVAASTAAAIAIPALGGDDPARTAPAPASVPAGFETTVAKANPSVVQIRSRHGLGSGVVFDDAGHVVTNAHVVEGARRFVVTASDGSKHVGILRGTFPEGDLAVIEVRGAHLKPAAFADSSHVQVGEIALAIGNPLGLRSSVTQGIVSSKSRTVSEGGGIALPSVIQTSAAINPGNSGGALVDATGAVIGIPTLAATDPQAGGGLAPGIGFAISSNAVKSIAAQLVEHGHVVTSSRAWLGVELRSLASGGVLVAAVTPGGPAARAGIQPGDVIARIAGHAVHSVDTVAVVLAEQHPGTRIGVVLREAGGSRTVDVMLGETPPAG
jgi:putative serine protease PepD